MPLEYFSSGYFFAGSIHSTFMMHCHFDAMPQKHKMAGNPQRLHMNCEKCALTRVYMGIIALFLFPTVRTL